MKAVLGKAEERLDIEDCGARDAQASAPSWTSTSSQLHKTLTHKDTLMRDNDDIQGPIIRSGGVGRRTQNKRGNQAFSRLMLISVVKLENVSLPNSTIHFPQCKCLCLPQGIGSQAHYGPPHPCLSEDLESSS